MTKAEKRLEDMRNNAKGWRYEEVASILKRHGFSVNTSGGGSHRTFKHASGVRCGLVDSGSGTLLPVYVRNAVRAIDLTEESLE